MKSNYQSNKSNKNRMMVFESQVTLSLTYRLTSPIAYYLGPTISKLLTLTWQKPEKQISCFYYDASSGMGSICLLISSDRL